MIFGLLIRLFLYLFGRKTIIEIEQTISNIIYQKLPENVINNRCQYKIGCKYHRLWDNNFRKVKEFGKDTIGFNNIEKNQILCYISNHRVINQLIAENNWSIPLLKELKQNEEKELLTQEQRNNLMVCYGYNKNYGSECIALRLKNENGDELSYDHIMTTVIHELTHNDVGNHGDKFKEK